MLKVILKEDVPGLGKAGEAKQVKDGYARNFLFPNNLVVLSTVNSIKQIEKEQKNREAKREQERKKAQEVAARLVNLSVTIAAEVNEEEKLYGSMGAQDIAKALEAEGIQIDKKSIHLKSPIKELGIYDVDVKLHADVVSKVKVWVVKK
jgi:large subunit ribosomal protein L9